jgi:hypothetical protein
MRRMLRIVFSWIALYVVLFAATLAAGQVKASPPEDSFYTNSLHYTNRGIEFIYSKQHGGLEKLTGMSAEELGCLQAKCHVRNVVTCFNCHIDTRIAEKKDIQIERHGLFFLVNREGEVTLGNFLSYVYGNKTMITVAPTFSHAIMEEGRACQACHATSIVRQVKEGVLELLSWRDGDAVSPEGVVPVVEGMKWNLAFLGRASDQWNPLEKPEPPLINFSGYCTPLSRGQLGKLERAQPEE